MKESIEQRTCEIAVYIIENKATVRSCARHFGISKSTVHKDLCERLPSINKQLYDQARQVMDVNKSERHIRGGMATKIKFSKKR